MHNTDAQKLRLTTKERLAVFDDLSTMLSAGIPILEALSTLEADSKGNPKKVLGFIRHSLYNGISLSSALKQMPKAFDPVVINMVKAAEVGGTLETTLRDIVVSTKKEMEFSEQIRNTMIYPLFVMGVFGAVVLLMLVFVIPRISEVFTSLRVNMPLMTRIMIKASTAFRAHWPIIIGLIFALLILIIVLIQTHRRASIRFLLSLPGLKKLGVNIDLARFSRSFGLLMHAGVPILEALSLSEGVVQNKEIVAIIGRMRIDVAAGKPMTYSFKKAGSVIPTVMRQSLKTAESSGSIDRTLENLTEHFDLQVSQSLKVLSSLFEPVLIVFVGVLVGFLMISIIAPIYSMISQINSSAGQ